MQARARASARAISSVRSYKHLGLGKVGKVLKTVCAQERAWSKRKAISELRAATIMKSNIHILQLRQQASHATGKRQGVEGQVPTMLHLEEHGCPKKATELLLCA